MSVVKLAPVFKDYLWGGTRLRDEFNKKCELEKVAESWELACHKQGGSTVASGINKGLSLEELIRLDKSVLGTSCSESDTFPLLIKLIDAKDDLSVQVHPDDEYALKVEGEPGKTEMWYVIDCDDDASLIYGFKDELSKEQFAQMIENGSLLDAVNKVKVHKGDVFFIPSGTLHAIGKGILIAEIQENSNTTYRVYDYGRVGADGKPRELHIEKAVEVTDTKPIKLRERYETIKADGCSFRLLEHCGYFSSAVFDVSQEVELCIDKRSFAHILFIEGSAKIASDEVLDAQKGDSFFIAAGTQSVRISGRCSFILTRNGFEEGFDRLVKEKP